MKQKDFDFIQHKFEQAQPPLPDGLRAECLKQRILKKESHKVIAMPKRTLRYKAWAVTAACLVMVCAAAVGAGASWYGVPVDGFQSAAQLTAATAAMTPVDTGEAGCAEATTVLTKQQPGVQQMARVQTENGYMYYAYSASMAEKGRNCVYVFEAASNRQQPLTVIENVAPAQATLQGVIAHGERLAVLARGENCTYLRIYSIAEPTKPVLLSAIEQSGACVQAGLVGENVYVLSHFVFDPKAEQSVPALTVNGEIHRALPEHIVRLAGANQAQYTVLGTVDVQTGKAAEDVAAVLGGGTKVQLTKKAAYVGASGNADRTAYGVKWNLKSQKCAKITRREAKTLFQLPHEFAADSTERTLYEMGDGWLSIEENLETAAQSLALYDRDFQLLDRLQLEDVTVSHRAAIEQGQKVFALPSYTADAQQRYYGATVFEIRQNKIVLLKTVQNPHSEAMYPGDCVLTNSCVYCFDFCESGDGVRANRFAHAYR